MGPASVIILCIFLAVVAAAIFYVLISRAQATRLGVCYPSGFNIACSFESAAANFNLFYEQIMIGNITNIMFLASTTTPHLVHPFLARALKLPSLCQQHLFFSRRY